MLSPEKFRAKVVGGDEQCNKSIIQNPGTLQGTVCIVKVSTPDNCLQRTMEILTTDGEYTFENFTTGRTYDRFSNRTF